jgi:hypothetical protein
VQGSGHYRSSLADGRVFFWLGTKLSNPSNIAILQKIDRYWEGRTARNDNG